MKRLFVFTALLVFPALMMAQNTHLRSVTEGEFADVSFFTNTSGFSSMSLQVSRGTVNGVSSATLQVSGVSEPPDFSSITIFNVFGPVPNSAFTGQNTQSLALSIDTSSLDPNTFFSESCTIDFNPINITCTQGQPVGVIQLNWTENDFVTTQINNHQVQTTGPVTTRTYQRADSSTANVTGTIFGTDVSGAPADVGVNHNSSIEVIRN